MGVDPREMTLSFVVSQLPKRSALQAFHDGGKELDDGNRGWTGRRIYCPSKNMPGAIFTLPPPGINLALHDCNAALRFMHH